MKRILIVIPLIVVLLFSGCGVKKEKANVAPPFFKVTDSETGGVVYMLGTIHVGKDNTVYPEEIYAALDESDVLAVELDLQRLDETPDEVAEAMKLLEYKEGDVRDCMGEDYDTIREALEEHFAYSENLEKYMPYVWTSMYLGQVTSECRLNSALGTDRAMLSYAKEHSKEIYEIETIMEQYSVNANTPIELQLFMLKDAVGDFRGQVEELNALYDTWKNGDFEGIEKLTDDGEIPDELKDDYKKYYDEMYTFRQEKMADYVIGALKNGEKAFVAVGALHYFASPDIIDYVEQAGYTVERIGSPLSDTEK